MINLEQLGVYLPQGFLFKDITLQINKGDKIGLAGKNGAGKSTLMRLLADWEKPTEGKIHRPKDSTIGFLTQDIKIDTTKTVFDYLNFSNEILNGLRTKLDQINHDLVERTDYEADSYLDLLDELNEVNVMFNLHEGFQWEEKIASTLEGLGFSNDDFHKPLSAFSGGWKMRAELAKILVNQPDIILLDEPTNHLDIISISWLENYLQKFDGAVIVISHDRLFLDNVTKRTLEISQQKIWDYPYNYSKYKIKREEELSLMVNAKKQQEKDIKHTKELIDKFRAKKNKASFAQSLIKKLDKTEIIEIEGNSAAKMKMSFPLSVQPGKWIMEMKDAGKRYGDRQLFKNINITVGRGEKIALLGPNGVGKSTLLKLVMKEIEGEGVIEYGHNVHITYFSQDQAEKLDVTKTIYETVDEIAEGEVRKDLRSILGTFLFSGDEIDKKVGVLSGGERTRLALCQLLLSPCNFLILDEPTNHLDIQSKEVLKQALINYEGTFLVVSHDREFLDGLTNRIWDIENQTLKIHHYHVKEYLAMKMADPEAHAKGLKQKDKKEVVVEKNEVKPVISQEEQKELKRKKTQLQNTVKKSEELIASLEQKIKELDEVLVTLDYTDEAKSTPVLESYSKSKADLDQAMEAWELSLEKLSELE
ncbi:MAG: ABC-F family ATP-binding cassette domain-containing protein [Crocinitomicaceae bacterium]|nr:ABC-F family ATP-binding cassette domain-containing protein [Crocinitomicaceae bacterium]